MSGRKSCLPLKRETVAMALGRLCVFCKQESPCIIGWVGLWKVRCREELLPGDGDNILESIEEMPSRPKMLSIGEA